MAGRAGRWRTGEINRERVLDAARACFAATGYDRASVRAIAEAAGVDQAMVFYFFGSKEKLFAEATRLPPRFAEEIAAVLDGPLDGVATRLVTYFVESLDATAGPSPLAVLTRSAPTHDGAAATLRAIMDAEVVDRVAARLDGTDARLRATLMSAAVQGLGVARYLVRQEPVASATATEIAARYGPAIQRLLTG